MSDEHYLGLLDDAKVRFKDLCETPQEEWNHVTTKNGCELYKRDFADSAIKVCKAVQKIAASTDVCVEFLLDLEKRKQWNKLLEETHIVHTPKDGVEIVYQRYKKPAPLISPRDLALVRAKIPGENGTVTCLAFSATHDEIPEKKGHVRGQLNVDGMIFTPQEGGVTQMTYFMHLDPMGSLPAWVINLTLGAAAGEIAAFGKLASDHAASQ